MKARSDSDIIMPYVQADAAFCMRRTSTEQFQLSFPFAIQDSESEDRDPTENVKTTRNREILVSPKERL
ncbi:hypothetical protein V6N13_126656 [Hibiscus sabdariffa]